MDPVALVDFVDLGDDDVDVFDDFDPLLVFLVVFEAGGAPTAPFAVVVGRAAREPVGRDPAPPRAPPGRDAGRREGGGVGRREGTP
ncbi:hypothetical protein GCM10007368_26910 [Isoptericola cucumis]|uniref:Uncharacterized protein n=1 Tax=Isoptericola cucumis TaxID=1776856 RepID=A0ABQ2B7N2_9MICO|nr:hypothetical protein GCM10007368_26910 [Isoptericola cucumis]